ncbi:MAG: DNA translocase FtsK 4TM domain-containing protein, partial [Pseudomonadota bacterium]|nr:DNA translocase FtsK 4TM domain-containing protein [Pseudomonadota bacterium]
MTFPLGSLRSDGGASNSFIPGGAAFGRDGTGAATASPHPPGWRVQLGLLVTGVLWLLAVLALMTHNAADAGFSTSGTSAAPLNKVGSLGAWFSDLAFFLFGYSVWWALLAGARAWLGTLARA